MKLLLILILSTASGTVAQPGKCDQTPPLTKEKSPNAINGVFSMTIVTKDTGDQNYYQPDQTYILILSTSDNQRPFRGFMITAEDPDVDNSNNDYDHSSVDVGSLKTLDNDNWSRYSERCYNSVENTDYSDKRKVEIHWVSPKLHHGDRMKPNQTVRLRAMIAENDEMWYEGGNLTRVLLKNENKPIDSPPDAMEVCNLCSEARYEVVFKGRWSRLTHPSKYPTVPDRNRYSYMIGASHAYDYTIWAQGSTASEGLKQLAEKADETVLERELINSIKEKTGTRTLIRGKQHYHPYMSEPSHSLFRVDRYHHLFSIVVAMRPSPDWFLGTSKFELCSDEGWLEEKTIPLYPWDAGTMDGISYESPTKMTQPQVSVDRVPMGSFNQDSPFYQKNLNDLMPFAILEVRRLDVYDVNDDECNTNSKDNQNGSQSSQEQAQDHEQEQDDEGPRTAEVRQRDTNCALSEWSGWSACMPDDGYCGVGTHTRQRYREDSNIYFESYKDQDQQRQVHNPCQDEDTPMSQTRKCNVNC